MAENLISRIFYLLLIWQVVSKQILQFHSPKEEFAYNEFIDKYIVFLGDSSAFTQYFYFIQRLSVLLIATQALPSACPLAM